MKQGEPSATDDKAPFGDGVTATVTSTVTTTQKSEVMTETTLTATRAVGLDAPPTKTPPPPAATPTRKWYAAPRPKGPESGRSFGDSPIRLEWDWTDSLVPNEEYFDVRVWQDAEADPFWTDWATASPYFLNLEKQPAGTYNWSVRVIRGHKEGDNKVFEGELSPDSERWSIQWAGPPPGPTDTPVSTPTPER
jgi:hypothetical protein